MRFVPFALLAIAACHASPSPPAEPATLIRGARVFDGAAVHDGLDVLIVGDRIAAVGTGLTAPSGATIVDGTGDTLLPGLIDSHFHTMARDMLRTALALGVTTVADMNMDERRLAAIRANPLPDEAELHAAGTLITAPGGHGAAWGGITVANADECTKAVGDRVMAGAEWIKIVVDDGATFYDQPLPALDDATVKGCVAAAHAAGKKVFAHISTQAEAARALDDGVDALAHLPTDVASDDAFVERLATNHVPVATTIVTEASIAHHGVGGDAVNDPAFAPFLEPAVAANLAASPPFPGAGVHVDVIDHDLAAYAAAGVPILLGTDSPVWGTAAGVSVHQELALLVAAGMTPIAALTSATATPADVFGWTDRGRIAPGLVADLVLVLGDPTTDITKTRDVLEVWHHGRAVDRDREIQRVTGMRAGAAAYDRKDYAEARRDWNGALALVPDDGATAYALASMESLLGDVDDALRHLHIALTWDPTLADAAAQDPDLANARKDARFPR